MLSIYFTWTSYYFDYNKFVHIEDSSVEHRLYYEHVYIQLDKSQVVLHIDFEMWYKPS